MTIKTIILDPGHGGIGPDGAYVTAGKRYAFDGCRTIYEGARMRVLASLLAERLDGVGFAVVSALSGKAVGAGWVPAYTDVPLSIRVAVSRRFDPRTTLYLSLHSNAISSSSAGVGQTRARGVSVYTSEGETGSDAVATALWHAIKACEAMPMRSQSYADGDPDYEAGFYVLDKTPCRANLLELGFHDHPIDAALLLDDEVLVAFADAICVGLEAAA